MRDDVAAALEKATYAVKQLRKPSLRERLTEMEKHLQAQLAEVQHAQQLLERHPEFAEFTDTVGNIAGISY